MNRMNRWVLSLIVTGMCAGAAHAQTVFFDDFEGNALLPHWTHSPPGEWVYSVSNSQLHVEELPWPSKPKNPTNSAGMFTRITPLEGDFRVRVRMGWEANSFPVMQFLLTDSSAHLITQFGYSGGDIYARTGRTQPMFFPGPPQGMHEFVVDRVESQLTFILNGELLVTLDGSSGDLLQFTIVFGTPYPGPVLDPLHVDLVHIVPASGAAIVLVITSGIVMTKRRR